MIRSATLLFTVTMGLGRALACSCFGPMSFCGTLDPQPPEFPEPEWWVPSDVVMAVIQGSEAYGVDVKVVQNWSGTLQPEQTIRVWGDCGLLCRHYVDGLPIGDTVIWALQHCDLSGNGSCGTNLESATDYQLSVCGVYWLNYANGFVSGPLTQEIDVNETVSLEAFGALVQGCLSTGVRSIADEAAALRVVRCDAGVQLLSDRVFAPNARVEVLDAAGRTISARNWPGGGMVIMPEPDAPGLYVVRLRDDRRQAVARWVRP